VTLGFDSSKRIPRRLYDRPVGILCESKYTMERSVDVGEEGMLVRATRPLNEGDNVLVNFWMDKIGYVIIPAQIRWIKNDEKTKEQFFGLFFLKVSFEYRRALRTYIAAKPAAELEFEKTRMLTFPDWKQEKTSG
jgi:c-di-GMP-binding flagellar brake protein YcgR